MKESKKILMLTPALPPVINGLGDYAYKLATEFRKQQVETIFICTGKGNTPDFACHYIKPNEKELLNKIKETGVNVVFVNYVGYAYHKKGIPFWLLNQLKEIKKTKIKLIVFFHEIYASGKLWQSVFWLKPLQRYIFHQIYNIADNCFCNTEKVLQITQNDTSDKGLKMKNIGIFSNIDEPEYLIKWEEREDVAVVFGSNSKRKNIWHNQKDILRIAELFQVKTIIDIGNGEISLYNNTSFTIKKRGELSSIEVSEILKKAKWGFIDYPTNLLGKSGIFAAYASHGLAVINFNKDTHLSTDGIRKNEHYTVIESIHTINSKNLSENVKLWYETKNRNNHLNKILKTLHI